MMATEVIEEKKEKEEEGLIDAFSLKIPNKVKKEDSLRIDI